MVSLATSVTFVTVQFVTISHLVHCSTGGGLNISSTLYSRLKRKGNLAGFGECEILFSK